MNAPSDPKPFVKPSSRKSAVESVNEYLKLKKIYTMVADPCHHSMQINATLEEEEDEEKNKKRRRRRRIFGPILFIIFVI